MITSTCPHGFGESDLPRCLDGAVTRLACLRCPLPVVLMADPSPAADAVNRALASRLPGLLSCPWTSPLAAVLDTAPRYSLPFLRPALPLPVAAAAPAPAGRVYGKPFTGSISRGKALALALQDAFFSRTPQPAKVGLKAILRCYRRVERAPYLTDADHLRRALRACSLPMRPSGNSFVVENSAHVRAFIRCYVKEAA